MTATDPELADAIEQGLAGWNRADMRETVAYFDGLLQRYPHDPAALYECGGAHDTAGDELVAADLYERALAAGLDGMDLRRCHVQLGSTLKNLGRLDESIAVFEAGLAEFPNSKSLRTFLALTLQEAGRGDEAVALLLGVIVDPSESPDLVHYRASVKGYAAELAARGRARS